MIPNVRSVKLVRCARLVLLAEFRVKWATFVARYRFLAFSNILVPRFLYGKTVMIFMKTTVLSTMVFTTSKELKKLCHD